MAENVNAKVVRDHFIGWQCRLRQYAMRRDGGRPSAGMRPVVCAGTKKIGELTVLIVKREAWEFIPEFRHMVRKTYDPAERYANAQRFFSAAYYQHPVEFIGELTALCGTDSLLVQHLLKTRHCTLHFEQLNQAYTLPCDVKSLDSGHAYYQFTYWHNYLFNPALPPDVIVLVFSPQWANSSAEPPVNTGFAG